MHYDNVSPETNFTVLINVNHTIVKRISLFPDLVEVAVGFDVFEPGYQRLEHFFGLVVGLL